MVDIQRPNLQITGASGIGDAAVWMFQTIQPYEITTGAFVVQRGMDALVFGVIGPEEADAHTQATALAQAVLAALPQQRTSGVLQRRHAPVGGRRGTPLRHAQAARIPDHAARAQRRLARKLA